MNLRRLMEAYPKIKDCRLIIAGLERAGGVHRSKSGPPMTALGQKRRSPLERGGGAFPLSLQYRTYQCAAAERRFVPEAESCTATIMCTGLRRFTRSPRRRGRARSAAPNQRPWSWDAESSRSTASAGRSGIEMVRQPDLLGFGHDGSPRAAKKS